jgi:hypothetical protein
MFNAEPRLRRRVSTKYFTASHGRRSLTKEFESTIVAAIGSA